VPDMRLVSTGGRIGLGGWISRGVFRVVQFGVLGLGLEPVEGFIGGALVYEGPGKVAGWASELGLRLCDTR
jgi:hypothetical protein